MEKSLKELSWNVSEEEYRADEAISYSTISYFEREGYRKLPNLKDKEDTKSLRYGSLVDCLLTDPDRLNDLFYISDQSRPSDTISKITEMLFEEWGGVHESIEKIPTDSVLHAIEYTGYYENWKNETRIEKVIKDGAAFYKMLAESANKTIISQVDYDAARYNVSILKTHEFTSKYFTPNPFYPIEHLYQLKFKIPYKSTGLRCMFDLILVDHKNKSITPCDLKTTGFDEDKFEDSFIKWGYIWQAQLYTHILKETISKDEYFKDFKIETYKFIVINRYNNTPLVWEFKLNHHNGNFLVSNGGSAATIRSWRKIYDDLVFHLNNAEYKYPKEAIENKGVVVIKNIEKLGS